MKDKTYFIFYKNFIRELLPHPRRDLFAGNEGSHFHARNKNRGNKENITLYFLELSTMCKVHNGSTLSQTIDTAKVGKKCNIKARFTTF